jgi:AGZA family xanthine/uracil permease-like MFS transporter
MLSKEGKQFNLSTEIIAGFTTFLTMAYIIFVNPQILSATGMDKTALIAITCLVSGLVTILTGLLTNTPIAMAPGMGLNAYFAYTLVLNQKISWHIALGIVFISGLFFFLLTLVGLREKLVQAIPKDLLNGIAVGIGIFIAFIGLQNLGIIVKNPATMVAAGPISKTALIGLAGLLLIILLEIKKIKGSLLIGIVFSTLLGLIFGYSHMPKHIISFNLHISEISGKLDIIGALKIGFLAPIFSLMFIDLFDSIGSLIGLAHEADMVDEKGNIPKLNPLLAVDAGATMLGAIAGTSTTTTYIESAAGIEAGGRTGITSITTGLLFILSMVFVPLLSIVPPYATAPALIMVGFFMMKNITKINFKDMEVGFPSFIIIIMIALSYSISTGLAFGFLSFGLIKIMRGKFKELSITMWVIDILSILFFVV